MNWLGLPDFISDTPPLSLEYSPGVIGVPPVGMLYSELSAVPGKGVWAVPGKGVWADPGNGVWIGVCNGVYI